MATLLLAVACTSIAPGATAFQSAGAFQPDDDCASAAGAAAGADEVSAAGASRILIDFKNETEQAAWLAKLTKEGLNCRSLMS